MCFVPVKGNKEHLGRLTKTFPLWIAMTIGEEYSYSKMTVINTTHLLWEQISAEVCVQWSCWCPVTLLTCLVLTCSWEWIFQFVFLLTCLGSCELSGHHVWVGADMLMYMWQGSWCLLVTGVWHVLCSPLLTGWQSHGQCDGGQGKARPWSLAVGTEYSPSMVPGVEV